MPEKPEDKEYKKFYSLFFMISIPILLIILLGIPLIYVNCSDLCDFCCKSSYGKFCKLIVLFLILYAITILGILTLYLFLFEKINKDNEIRLRHRKLDELNEIRKEISPENTELERTETTEETSNNQVINKSTKNTKTYGSLYKNIIESIVEI